VSVEQRCGSDHSYLVGWLIWFGRLHAQKYLG
jgi:hypothetical protein